MMLDFFNSLDPMIAALLATIFTWFVTLLGASLVYFFKSVNKNLMDGMLGFAAGIMIAASFFSLLMPAQEMAEGLNMTVWLVLVLGFISGGILLFIGDKVFEHFYKKNENSSSMKRILMLIFSITLHNIPEGLAVGVAFGSIAYGLDGATMGSALVLALGIGIQNFPEGAIISMPLKEEGTSKAKAFLFGTLSGAVEPLGALLTILLTKLVVPVLPYLLSFAAGAMIYVVVEELIPESQSGKHSNIGTIGVALGFVLMMILDVALG